VNKRPRVLIADDEVRLAEALRQGLERHGYACTVVHDGTSALAKALAGGYDLVLLDLMLPGLSGYRVVEALRAKGISTPVLMLTAKDGEYDEADAFELGVDDYVTKPFSTVVLLARMSALIRRRGETARKVLSVGPLFLEPRKHVCQVAGRDVDLTAREYAALTYLAERSDEVVSKAELLDEVWDEPDLDPNVVEVCILQVRKKLGIPVIQTVRGVGYRLTSSAVESP
jgi:two-component system, OmpR family, response regulator